MRLPHLMIIRRAAIAAAVTVLGSVGCDQGSSTKAGASGGAGSSGGATTGTGGTTLGPGGSGAGTGGAIAASGGSTAGAGGSGGRTGGTGGKIGGTGGNAAGAGGRPTDGGGRDLGPGRSDGPTDLVPGKDGSPDTRPGPSDVSLADSGPLADSGITIPSGYKLVWSDEFDVDGAPNAKNWTYEKGFARNEELQWYQADNAQVKDGLLIIEGRKERVSNPGYKAGSSDWKTSRQYAEYTSTSMTTSGLQTWQYGRFELRARIPTSAGMWPAWWTLGVSGEWPSSGEIDIMEYYNGKVLANVACGTATRWEAKWDSSTKSLSSLGGSTWSSSFHVWRMDWDDQKIDLYLDDTLMNSATLSSMLNADGTSPFKQKQYMLVNLAIGGTNGGDPSGTTFPVKYEVDYVRVFQKL